MTPKIEFIRAVDIRDWGLIDEDTIPIEDMEDLTELYEGIDEHGVAQ